MQLKKFVQRINNGRRTTVSKCRVYLATNKASTRRYPWPQEICLSLFLPPSLSLSSSFSISLFLALVLCLRPLLSLVARMAATLNDSATHYEKNVPHIRKEIKVLRLHFSTLALVSVFPFLSFALLRLSHYLIALAFTPVILHNLIIMINMS